jgi:hypothetical protein
MSHHPSRRRMRRLGAVALFLALTAGALIVLALASGAAAVSQAAPVNTAEPRITGQPVVGETVSVNTGSWSGTKPITYTYQWGRCTSEAENSCKAISGAREPVYTIVGADAGFRLRARVSASNLDGSASALANPTAEVTPGGGAPANESLPTIVGSAVENQVLTANAGLWGGLEPITYAYQWKRCNTSGGGCVDISGAAEQTYKLKDSEVGRTVRVRVRASNSAGAAAATSAATGVVAQASGSDGPIKLPNGKTSVPVASVPKGERLIVQNVRFSPNPVTSRAVPITTVVSVTDTRGNVVREAKVFIRSTPVLTIGVPDGTTQLDGTVVFSIMPRHDFPLKTGYNVQFFVKAYRQGDDPLAGVSGTRLVQVATQSPS